MAAGDIVLPAIALSSSFVARRTRFETFIDAPIEAADEGAVNRLVQGRVREDADLDFKQALYGSSDTERRNLASDVAALANAVGGVLVLGIRDENGEAAELTTVEVSDEAELRMRQVVASMVFPAPEWRIHRIPAMGGRGYYLLEVPPSPLAPHAVRISESLRYPKRDGARTRHLTESEVADAYRNRFTLAASQVARIEQVVAEGRERLVEVPERAFLVLALVPTSHAEMKVNVEQVWRHQRLPMLDNFPVFTQSTPLTYSPIPEAGYRRVIIYFRNNRSPQYGLLHLHSDGCGFVGLAVGQLAADRNNEVLNVYDERLTQEVLVGLSLLGAHAVETCHAQGDALVSGTIHGDRGIVLINPRDFPPTMSASPPPSVPLSQHTVALDDLTGSATNLAVVAHGLLADLVQAFGEPEPLQISPDGQFRLKYFSNTMNERNQLKEHANRLKIVVTEESVG